jgi:hypothetical protein
VRQPIAAGLLVFALALAALVGLRQGAALHPAYPKRRVVTATLHNGETGAYLRAHLWTRTTVIAFDETRWRATFWNGSRLVLDAAVGPTGEIDAVETHGAGTPPPGASVLWNPFLIVLLAALSTLAVAVSPVRSRRNLDAVLIAGTFTAAALLARAELVSLSVCLGTAALAYVAYRCTTVGFARDRATAVSDPLYRRAFARANSERTLTYLCVAALLAAVGVTVTSTGIVDVGEAGLVGATLLNHGTVPYGHMPAFVVHGDTYPPLTYILLMPFAAISPATTVFESFDGALWLCAVALVVAAAGLGRSGGRTHVLAWLTFPPVLLAASAGTNDVPAAAFVALALAVFGRPLLSAALLVLAGWVKIVPAAALASWTSEVRGRSVLHLIALITALVAAGLVFLVAIDGPHTLSAAYHAMRFQLVRGSWFSIWQQFGLRWLQPIFQAAVFGFGAAVLVYVRGRRRVERREAAALAGALIALLQISASYWIYTYLPWLVPFILVALFPPGPRRSQPLEPDVP